MKPLAINETCYDIFGRLENMTKERGRKEGREKIIIMESA
jgi:hypothetical protein